MTKHLIFCFMAVAVCALSSCSDFFEVDSDNVVYSDKNHLSNATDTTYSIVGIIAKMGAITDRTILLGEARGDLVDVTTATSSDLRDVAQFNIGDDNQFNRPADYYAIINNCNYLIDKADIEMRNNRNEQLFLKDYAAAKAFRAWTYLQLALNYGEVPFVEKPILTKEQSERKYDRYDIQRLCQWLINDLQDVADVQITGFGNLNGSPTHFMFIPIPFLLGELNLWAGNYREAALAYYNYLSRRNGINGAYPTGTQMVEWNSNTTNYNASRPSDTWTNSIFSFAETSYNANNEAIFTLHSDSLPSEPNYSMLFSVFNSQDDNNYEPSLVPSKGMADLSLAQTYCQLQKTGDEYSFVYPPKDLNNNRGGDLRFSSCVPMGNTIVFNNERKDYITNRKYVASTRRIIMYRRTTAYLHMAEALNRAGFPRFAYAFLSRGVNNDTIAQYVTPYYPQDSAFIAQFNFPAVLYKCRAAGVDQNVNMMGLHDRGCGWSAMNADYQLPLNPEWAEDDAAQTAYQMPLVEDMIVNEEALEFAFEGQRFYDLMRVALRRNDAAYLADRVYARRGEANRGAMQGEIKKDLYNKDNWFMKLK